MLQPHFLVTLFVICLFGPFALRYTCNATKTFETVHQPPGSSFSRYSIKDVKRLVGDSAKPPTIGDQLPKSAADCIPGEQMFCDGEKALPRCIPLKWKCDGQRDCLDGSDEPPFCPATSCPPNQFTCRLTRLCLPPGFRCDRDDDCGVTSDGRLDDSDEDPLYCQTSVSCPSNEHKCLESDVCIRLDRFCDHHVDCPDGSDEGAFCDNKKNVSLNCTYGQVQTPDVGARCFCGSGLVPTKQGEKTVCVDEDECQRITFGAIPACDQLCRNANKSYTCSCVSGYRLVNFGDNRHAKNQSYCQAVNVPPSEPALMIFSRQKGLTVLSADLKQRKASYDTAAGVTAFDFDHRRNRICWIEKSLRSSTASPTEKKSEIVCASINDPKLTPTLRLTPEFSLQGVRRMSYDWVGDNWYFLDDSYNRVFVCDARNASSCFEVSSTSIFDEPREMALDPAAGFVFVADVGQLTPGLYRLAMDGRGSEERIVGAGIIHPSGLALDQATRVVYLLDAYLDYVDTVDYDLKYRRRRVAVGSHIKSLTALAVFERWLYTSDPLNHRVMRMDKFDGLANFRYFPARRDEGGVVSEAFERVNGIRVFHRQMQPDVEHPCATAVGGCQHVCLVSYSTDSKTDKRTPKALCKCRDGYRLKEDGKSCLEVEIDSAILIYGKTQPGVISAVAIDTSLPPSYLSMRPIRSARRPTAVAVGGTQLFFSDAANFTIQHVDLTAKKGKDGHVITTLIDHGVHNCEGLAIDWSSRILYWSDEGLQHICAALIDRPHLRRVLVVGNLSHPRALSVHPPTGYLFWSDWSDGKTGMSAKIERSFVDGSNRTAIVTKRLHWTNGIAIDSKARLLYWCDAYYDNIERVDFDGNHRKIIVGSNHLNHPYGLALHKGFIFWSEYRAFQIYRAKLLKNGSMAERRLIRQDTSSLIQLAIFDPNSTSERNLCASKSNCDHFCFFVMNAPACGCADGFTISVNDTSKCIASAESSTGVLEGGCPADGKYFQCKRNKRCIPETDRCNGDDDCDDGTDELDCEAVLCGPDQFKCASNRCIPEKWRCDGSVDCAHLDDELNCTAGMRKCREDEFRCAESERCIPRSFVCDREPDCNVSSPSTSSDEQAAAGCFHRDQCAEGQFRCTSGQCIALAFRCDGDRDCRDDSDEQFCSAGCDKATEFRCNNDTKSPCLSIAFRCDTVPDCPDGADERDCPVARYFTPSSCPGINQWRCSQSGECIRSAHRCDGSTDCLDGSDEHNCSTIICDKSQELCENGKECYYKKYRCDGHLDCSDGSDEKGCIAKSSPIEKCAHPSRHCVNDSSVCVPATKLCDGVSDCSDKSDEGMLCDLKMCNISGVSMCQQTCFNAPDGYVCGCKEGYFQNADKTNCSKGNPCESWGVCDQLCVAQGKFHTGTHYFCHCADGYQLAADKFSCKSTASADPRLIYSIRHELRMVGGLRLASGDGERRVLAVNLRNAIAVDFFYRLPPAASQIFWTDAAHDAIFSAVLTPQGALTNVTKVISGGLASTQGLAVDWIGSNLYWIDSLLNQIEVSQLDGGNRTVVISEHNGDIGNIRALAIDARDCVMFWTDWDRNYPRVERATLAGTDRVVVFNASSADGVERWPNGITVDLFARRIYWADAKSDKIHTTDYNGGDHRVILSGHGYLTHPYGLVIFEQHVYWSDWRQLAVLRANKWNGSDVQIVAKTGIPPFDLKIIHPSQQPTSTKNRCQMFGGNGNCSHLCLREGLLSHRCACPYQMRLDASNITCIAVNESLLYANGVGVFGISIPYTNELSKSQQHSAAPSVMVPLLGVTAVNTTAIAADMRRRILVLASSNGRTVRTAPLHTVAKQADLTAIVDAGLEHAESVAVDWISGNVYFTTWNEDRGASIQLCAIDGRFRRELITHRDGLLRQPREIAINPLLGTMYWFDGGYEHTKLFGAGMDGSNPVEIVVKNNTVNNPTSVFVDYTLNRLYYVERGWNYSLFFVDLDSHQTHGIDLTDIKVRPSLVALGGGQEVSELFYYDESSPSKAHIGRFQVSNLIAHGPPTVLKNVTGVTALYAMDASVQSGLNGCDNGGQSCSGRGPLCVPFLYEKKEASKPVKISTGCRRLCPQGHVVADSTDSDACLFGHDQFLVFAEDGGIFGIVIKRGVSDVAMPPISNVAKVQSIDYDARYRRLYWLDETENRIYAINFNSTGRSLVVKGGWARIRSVAVDYLAGNIYWTATVVSSKGRSGVIEVANLNGEHRIVIVTEENSVPRFVNVDPRGHLLWVNASGIQRANLDGTDIRQVIAVNGDNVHRLTLDMADPAKGERFCYLLHISGSLSNITCAAYNGSDHLNVHSFPNNADKIHVFAIHGGEVFWYHWEFMNGSIIKADIEESGKISKRYEMKTHQMKTTLTDMKVVDFDANRLKSQRQSVCWTNNGGCDHLCLLGSSEGKCWCSMSVLSTDRRTCKDFDMFLVYSRSRSIEFAQITAPGSEPNPPFPPINSPNLTRNVVGLSYVYKKKRLFYSDIQQGRIMSINFNGSNPIVVASGLAYDDVHGDLYWTSFTNASIGRIADVLSVNARNRIVVRLGAHDKPRGIAVDPCQMRLYWTNWNEKRPSIDRSYLSGYGRQTIISKNIRIPNAIAIDFRWRRLYWADAGLDKIERCHMNGEQCKVVLGGTASSQLAIPSPHPFGITLYGDQLYFTDWILRALVRVNKFTGGDRVVVRTNFNPQQAMGLQAVAADAMNCALPQCTEGSTFSLKCVELCLVKEDTGEPYCACRGERIVNPQDPRRCMDREELVEDAEEALAACAASEFRCADGRCIDYEEVCDGVNECTHNDDELPELCGDRRECRKGYVLCRNNGQCILEARRCDGVNDCGDFSDELDCQCNDRTQFNCDSGMCIDKSGHCNNRRDCNDASDEKNCGVRNCSAVMVAGERLQRCGRTTQCIRAAWMCDGHNDCWDNWDEENCPAIVGSSQQTPVKVAGSTICSDDAHTFRCTDASQHCIPIGWRCDYDYDCPDKSDERNCPEPSCESEKEFTCADGKQCIPLEWKCDGGEDCNDRSDELGCKNDCRSGFRCSVSEICIDMRFRCDGSVDCGDGDDSDERGCDRNLFNNCGDNEFLCENGKCISHDFYCDGEDECGDGSDEPITCELSKCASGSHFECDHNLNDTTWRRSRCIPISWKCNGITDCDDRTDENCDGLSTMPTCDGFQCKNGVCLSTDLMCNKHNDCGDWSDERSCGVNECEQMIPCEDICNDLKIGFNCSCRHGFKLAADGRSCVEYNMCTEELPCSQICFNRRGFVDCVCHSGYTLAADGSSCKHLDHVEPLLLLSSRYSLQLFTVHGHSKGVLLSNLTEPVAIDVHYHSQRIFVLQRPHNEKFATISVLRFNSTTFVPVAASYEQLKGLKPKEPDGLAVDWAGGNLYWCDKQLNTIEVATLEGNYRHTLLKGGSLQAPRALVLDPFSKYLFWSDCGRHAHIGRVGMDGRESKLLVTTSLKWPNALAVDPTSDYLFWADAALDYIGMCDYEGKGLRSVLKLNSDHRVFSIAVFEQYIYWTDWKTGQVERVHKFSGKDRKVIVNKFPHRPMGIKVLHPLSQPALSRYENACADGGWCSNLCFLSNNAAHEYRCECADGFRLADDQHSCLPDCKPWEFVCDQTYKCLPLWWRCDGQNDCGDGQDELHYVRNACPIFRCTPGEFMCLESDKNDSAVCLSPSQLCDGRADCPMADDEGNNTALLDCATYECTKGQFKCPNSSLCIPDIKRCDTIRDCPGGEDEQEKDCPPRKSCDVQLEMRCLGDRYMCLSKVFICDGDKDCPLGDDEGSYCATRKCNISEFRCDSGQCIPSTWLCDGTADCKDRSDEAHCPSDGERNLCKQHHFNCSRGQPSCIAIVNQCDGEPDCSDGSDEANCPLAPKNLRCSDDEWLCASGDECIAVNSRCDGVADCADETDELPAECKQAGNVTTCSTIEFACASGKQCVRKAWRCDGEIDCIDASDENDCPDKCTADQFQCADAARSSIRCISKQWVCDEMPDCRDKSDEQLAICQQRACPPSYSKCANGRCYPSHLACDGVAQCRDASDERNDTTCSDKCTGQFHCDSGHCIHRKYRCDTFDDCGDMSDERQCAMNVCEKYGVCPQKCQLPKHISEHPKCYCADGYQLLAGNSGRAYCKFNSDTPPLLIVAHRGLHFRSLTRHSVFHGFQPDTDGQKVNAFDFWYNNTGALHLFFVDKSKVNVMATVIDPDLITHSTQRRRRSLANSWISTDLDHHSPPVLIYRGVQVEGITVDYENANLYIIDMGIGQPAIKVVGISNMNRPSQSRTVLMLNLEKPQAIAVSPLLRRLFWTDIGRHPRVESANLDGGNRTIIANHQILYPTGITVDEPNERIYWADLKSRTIETTLADGRDRNIVKRYRLPPGGSLSATSDYAPLRLRASPNTLWVVGYPVGDVHPIDKFTAVFPPRFRHRRNVRYYAEATTPYLNAAHIVIAHPTLQQKRSAAYCDLVDCGEERICIPPSPEHDGKTSELGCHCPDRKKWDVKDNKCMYGEETRDNKECHCENGGLCLEKSPNGVLCRCPSKFEGPQCHIDRCYNRCLNNGTCFVDPIQGTVLCRCPLDYDGDRCERYKCTGVCSTHGSCYISIDDGLPKCRCDNGYMDDTCATPRAAGGRCGADSNFCFNGGTCNPGDGTVFRTPFCECPVGYTGLRCQHCSTDLLFKCHNGGFCIGDKKCRCANAQFTGEHCELDKCLGHCANGGTCLSLKIGALDAGSLLCKCKDGYSGSRCEIDPCPTHCTLSAGVLGCRHTPNGAVCVCKRGWRSPLCLQRLPCSEYCLNGGSCFENHDGSWSCQCRDAYFGERCERRIACRDHCSNGASCTFGGNGVPLCECPKGLTGERCERVLARNCSEIECMNGGRCQQKLIGPVCVCRSGWMGAVCLQAACTPSYCLNAGSCLIMDGLPFCRCSDLWKGDQCEISKIQFVGPKESSNPASILATVLLPLVLAVTVIMVVLYLLLVKRKRRASRQFSHKRMDDPLDDDDGQNQFQNPAFMLGEDARANDDEHCGDAVVDETTHFTNPMYDSVYNETVVSAAEADEAQRLLKTGHLEIRSDDQ